MIEKLKTWLLGEEQPADRSWVGPRISNTEWPEGPRDFNSTWGHIYQECKKISCRD